MKIEDTKIITREQFKTIFFKLFEYGSKELLNDVEKEGKKIILPLNKEYINKIFNNLIKEETKEIFLDKIIDYFEPNNILFALKDTLNLIGLDKAIESIKEELIIDKNALEEKIKNKESEKNTDL